MDQGYSKTAGLRQATFASLSRIFKTDFTVKIDL